MRCTDTRPFAAPTVEDNYRTKPQTRRAERVETTPIRLTGELTLEATALPRLLRLLDGRPRLARVVRAVNGQLTFIEGLFRVSANEWEALHRGLLLIAGLAFEGHIHIEGRGGWETSIPASGDPPRPRRNHTLTSLMLAVPREHGVRMLHTRPGVPSALGAENVASDGPRD